VLGHRRGCHTGVARVATLGIWFSPSMVFFEASCHILPPYAAYVDGWAMIRLWWTILFFLSFDFFFLSSHLDFHTYHTSKDKLGCQIGFVWNLILIILIVIFTNYFFLSITSFNIMFVGKWAWCFFFNLPFMGQSWSHVSAHEFVWMTWVYLGLFF